jgi:glycerophosphoryl diester phosphodiesterase
MNKMKTALLTAAMMFAMGVSAQTKVIAHRGYWKSEGSAQNSLAALKAANDLGVYGSEFDVQLTSDGVAIVNHDDNYQGYEISDTPYSTLQNLKLSNGESLPTLDAYLRAGKGYPNLQMILEVKPQKTKEAEDKLTRIIVDMVKKYGMEKQTEYISFSMNVCEQLVQLTPQSEIYYLGSDKAPSLLKEKGITGIDYFFLVLQAKSEWVAEAHSLGMKVNAWTVDYPDMVRGMRDLKVDFITTDLPVETKAIVAE